MTFALRSLVAAVLLVVPAAAQRGPIPTDFDATVQKAMKAFEVPGLAVAVVKDGKVVLAKGYGVRRLGDPGRVDADTRFGIASNTKAFTAAAVALLVDEGKLTWDDRVQKHLPAFKVDDPYVSRELTVRDLLCHRTGLGLGQGDLMYWPDTTFTREEVVAAAAHMKPSSSLRSRYAYNNFTFVVAGELVAKVSGMPYESFVAQRLLKPLGMARSVISSDGLAGDPNVAVPHAKGWRFEGPLVPLVPTRDYVWAGAAGLKSSVNDLAKWVALQLAGGKLPEGAALISAKAMKEMASAQIPLRIGDPVKGLEETTPQFSAYGLGWSLRDYLGHKVVSHGGALTGMVSTVQWVPDQNLGIIVLTNQEDSGALSSLVYTLLDHQLGRPAKDWVGAFKAAKDERLAKTRNEEKAKEDKRVTDSKPALALGAYAGRYRDAWYGEARVDLEGDRLVLRMARTPSMVADLRHWQHDTFRAVFRDANLPDAYLTFDLDPEGSIVKVRMVPASDLADFSFDFRDLDLRPVK